MTNPDSANAQALSEATNRRGFLRSVIAAGASVTASVPLALTCSPALATTAIVPAEPEESRDLLDLAQRVGELSRERHQAVADLRIARIRFAETGPLPPRPRKKVAGFSPFKIVRNPGPHIRGAPIECSIDRAYDFWWGSMRKSPNEAELVRKELFHVSERYVWKLHDAAEQSGYEAASRRSRELDDEIRRQSGRVFEFEPKTGLGVAALASTLLVGFDVGDGRSQKEFAQQLAASAIRVAEGQEART